MSDIVISVPDPQGSYPQIRAEFRDYEMDQLRFIVFIDRYVTDDRPSGELMEFEFFRFAGNGVKVIRGLARITMVDGAMPAKLRIQDIKYVLFEYREKVQPGEYGHKLTVTHRLRP